MKTQFNSKCYIDNTSDSINNCADCRKPICGTHGIVQNRYVDRYSHNISVVVCSSCAEIYNKATRIRSPFMIIISIILIIVLMLSFFRNFSLF
jgi:predicted nucleic acid-binding Zn ribbon protein